MIQPYNYQLTASERLIQALQSHGAALDASDTGTGKTVTALHVARSMNLVPLIICPKTIISSWGQMAEAMGVEPQAVVNVEKLRTGRQKWVAKGARKADWYWQLPPRSLIIWDEVQTAGGNRTLNAYLLATLRFKAPVLMLSATVADSPLRLQAPGYLLGLHRFKDYLPWCLAHGCYVHPVYGGLSFDRGVRGKAAMLEIHNAIFPAKGTRVRIADIPDFPETLIVAEPVDVKVDRDEVNALCGNQFWTDDMEPSKQACALTSMLRARQLTEVAKVPAIVEMCKDLLDEGRSVIIFICFLETMGLILRGLPVEASVIVGGQTKTERDAQIAAFQNDERRVIVSMIQAGGVGISLHDIRGQYPRHAILTPPLSVVQLKQALGRPHRAGGKSKSVQTVLFAAGTVEEEACRGLNRKLDQLSLLNDGELAQPLIGNKA
jgi:superfamily II DNA or RNA helicase